LKIRRKARRLHEQQTRKCRASRLVALFKCSDDITAPQTRVLLRMTTAVVKKNWYSRAVAHTTSAASNKNFMTAMGRCVDEGRARFFARCQSEQRSGSVCVLVRSRDALLPNFLYFGNLSAPSHDDTSTRHMATLAHQRPTSMGYTYVSSIASSLKFYVYLGMHHRPPPCATSASCAWPINPFSHDLRRQGISRVCRPSKTFHAPLVRRAQSFRCDHLP